MKLRLGFVTNSSSTNYLIIWRGQISDLKNVLLKYKQDFQNAVIENIEQYWGEDPNPYIDMDDKLFGKMVDNFCNDLSEWARYNEITDISKINVTTYDSSDIFKSAYSSDMLYCIENEFVDIPEIDFTEVYNG